jgi:hypothetical protein
VCVCVCVCGGGGGLQFLFKPMLSRKDYPQYSVYCGILILLYLVQHVN